MSRRHKKSPVTESQNARWRADLLHDFAPIQLSEMGHVALLRRTDTKYLLSEEQLVQALTHLTGDYRVLTIEGGEMHLSTGDDGIHSGASLTINGGVIDVPRSYEGLESIVFSSPELENGATYLLFAGGSSTETPIDGLYSGGTYTGGRQEISLTLTGIITGAAGGGMPGAPGGRDRRPGGRP